MSRIELFGMGIAARHHGGAFGESQIRLPQPQTVLFGQPIEALDGGMRQLGVGRETDRLGLHGGVDRDPCQVLAAQGADLMRDPQALGQQQLQLGAEPAAPMAQI